MSRGRKRKFNPAIPGHIDQSALPRGLYWEDNRWYILESHPEGGRPRKRTVAHANARLSELHAIVEAARGLDPRGSVKQISDLFHRSSEFTTLSPRTQKDYRWLAGEACAYVLKDGSMLGQYQVERMNVPMVQRLVESIATGREARGQQPALPATPTKANHILRYLRRVFGWALRMGYCPHNPAKGVRQVEELGEHRMPEPEVFDAVLKFAKERGGRAAHSRGSTSPYLHAVMVIAYSARLRGIEVNTLSDAEILKQGIVSNRRKGSRDNITRWNHDLKRAVIWLIRYRHRLIDENRLPIPVKANQRYLVVSERARH